MSTSTNKRTASDGRKGLDDQLKQAAASFQQEQQKLARSSERSRNKANQLRKEGKRMLAQADRFESKAKRLQIESNEANRLRCSLEFEATCRALQRNEASVTHVNVTSDYPHGYAQKLGKALQQSTHVTSLSLCIRNAIPRIDKEEPPSEDSVKRHIAPLVDYVSESQILRSVSFSFCMWSDDIFRALQESLVGACFRSRSIDSITQQWPRTVPAAAFQNCHAASQLKTLHVDLIDSYSDHDRRVIGNAFGLLSCLKELYMEISDSILAESILTSLQSAGCSMSRIKLFLTDDDVPGLWSALSALLHSTAKRVESLSLGYFSFNVGNIQALLNCLRQENTSTQTTVSELLFADECNFDSDAKRVLLEFMHTRAEQDDSSLTSLYVARSDDSESSLSATDVLSMVCMQSTLANDEQIGAGAVAPPGAEEEWYPTIGSNIKSLNLCGVENFPEALADTGTQIRLEKLELTGVERHDISALACCVSTIPSLRELHLEAEFHGSARPLLVGLRENGTVQSFQGDFQSRLTDAFCERNKHLDQLLRETATRRSETEKAVTDVVAVEGQNSKPTSSFCPPLLDVAMQVPKSSSAMVLRSLMQLRSAVGIEVVPEEPDAL